VSIKGGKEKIYKKKLEGGRTPQKRPNHKTSCAKAISPREQEEKRGGNPSQNEKVAVT